jgi:hypothetical protein
MPATVSHALSMTRQEKINARYAVDPEFRNKQQAANRAWYEKNKVRRQEQCREYQRKRHAEKPEHVSALQKAWNAANPARIAATRAKRRPAYREKEREYSRQWAAANPDKIRAARLNNIEKWRERYRLWYAANRGREIERSNLRRAKKLMALPAWADRAKIRNIYEEARRLSANSITG